MRKPGITPAGSQGSNVFALYLGLVPAQDTARVAARVDEDVRRRGYHLTTGNLMTKYLLEVLTAYGYLETAYRLVVPDHLSQLGLYAVQGCHHHLGAVGI